MDTLKKFTKYEKEILEGIIISIVGGWALTSILRGAYKQISNIQFPAQHPQLSNLYMPYYL